MGLRIGTRLGRALSLSGAALIVSIAVLPAEQALAGRAAIDELQRAAYEADYKGGIARLGALTTEDPGDFEARFALGGLQFLGAFATMQEKLWQHSTATPAAGRDLSMLGAVLPMGALMGGAILLPPNPKATPMTYAELRQILSAFIDDMAAAERTLAGVGDREVKVPLEPLRIALDLNHDGVIAPHERFFATTFAMGRSVAVRAGTDDGTIMFDTADASWLRGYANLMMASAELFLAFDFERTYDAAAHDLYGNQATAFGRALERLLPKPRPLTVVDPELAEVKARLAQLNSAPHPNTRIGEIRQRLAALPRTPETADERRRLEQEQATLRVEADRVNTERTDLYQRQQRLTDEKAGRPPGSSTYGILDLVAAVHSVSWHVVEPQRLKSLRTHLVQVMASNARTWALVRAETDDDHEWLPSPRQTPPFGARALSDEVIDSWLATTRLAEDVLEGRKLLPHPRFTQGVNLKRLLETVDRLDLVMLVAGHDLVPYLEEGDIVDSRTWTAITSPMRQDMWIYAAWFN